MKRGGHPTIKLAKVSRCLTKPGTPRPGWIQCKYVPRFRVISHPIATNRFHISCSPIPFFPAMILLRLPCGFTLLDHQLGLYYRTTETKQINSNSQDLRLVRKVAPSIYGKLSSHVGLPSSIIVLLMASASIFMHSLGELIYACCFLNIISLHVQVMDYT